MSQLFEILDQLKLEEVDEETTLEDQVVSTQTPQSKLDEKKDN
jgi:hypothetical protein